MPAPRVLWAGKVDDVDVRIVGTEGVDCYVEEASDDRWFASEDERASHAYAQAFMECRTALERLYDRDMGNLNLKSGLDALEGVGKLLGRDG